MKKANPISRLRHMHEYAEKAVRFAQPLTRASLEDDANESVVLGVIKAIEIVGEAAAKIAPETRKQHPQVKWDNIIGMRNRLVHGYDAINYDIVWRTLSEELPLLITQLDKVLSDYTDQN